MVEQTYFFCFTQFQKTAIQRPPRPFFTVAKVGVASSSLVFRSKRLAEMRGVFVWGWCWRSSGGWEPSAPYVIDNQTHPIHPVPNLVIREGVGNRTPHNSLIIRHLIAIACQTYCIVLKKIGRRNGLAGKATRRTRRTPSSASGWKGRPVPSTRWRTASRTASSRRWSPWTGSSTPTAMPKDLTTKPIVALGSEYA